MSSPSSSALPPNFSFLNQTIEVITVYGPYKIPITELDEFYRTKILMAIFFGLRVGASAVVAIILLLITQNRRTPVFIFNQISLIFLFIQSSLYLQYLNSPYSLMSTALTGSYEAVRPRDTNVSVASSVFQFLLICAVCVSLFFQVRVVFPPFSMARNIASAITSISVVLCCVVNLLYIISRCYSALNPTSKPIFGTGHFNQILPSFSQYAFAASIALCSVTLLGKLAFAIRTRRILGLRQFGPFEIIVIMSAQTMIVPVILYIMNNSLASTSNGNYLTGVGSLAPLAVVIFLPMSSMWASAANTSAISRQEMIFSNHRNSEVCVCGRPKYGGDDDDETFDYRSQTTSYNNRKMDRYYSETEKNVPNTAWGKVQRCFIKVERAIHHAVTYKSRKALKQAKRRVDMELAAGGNAHGGDQYAATTQLSISNVHPNPAAAAITQHQNNPFAPITPAELNISSTDDMPKTPSTLCSPNSGRQYYDGGVYYGHAKKDALVTSVHRVPSNSDTSDDSNCQGNGIIINKDDAQSPTETMVSNRNSKGNNVLRFSYDENERSVAFDDDLLSLNGDENEEEYYNRMKSKYNPGYSERK